MKKISLFNLAVLTTLIFLPQVLAAEPWDSLKKVVTLEFLSNIGFQSSFDPVEGFIRFIVLILLFVLLFELSKLLKLGKSAGVVIALALSLISAIFIPGAVLVAAATSYATVFSVALLGVPLAILGAAFFFLKEHHWIRVFVMATMVYVLHLMSWQVSRGTSISTSPHFQTVISTVDQFIVWVLVVAWVLAIISLLQAFGSIGGSSDHHPNWMRRLWDRAAQQTVHTEKGKELRHAKIEETRLLSDLTVEKKELELLQAAKEKLLRYNTVAKDILRDKKVNSENHLTTFKSAYDAFSGAFEEITRIQHQWKRAERREVREMRRLIKEMISKGVSDSDRKNIEAEEQLILNSYIMVTTGVKKAEKAVERMKEAHDIIHKAGERHYKTSGVDATKPWDIVAKDELNALTKLQGNIGLCYQSIEEARKEEEDAVTRTTGLAEEIKRKWVV